MKSEQLRYCWLFFTWSPYFQVKICYIIHFRKSKHTYLHKDRPGRESEKYEISWKCKKWPKFRESAKNGRNSAHGLNCIIFVNSELIFEIYDENYPTKKISCHSDHFEIFVTQPGRSLYIQYVCKMYLGFQSRRDKLKFLHLTSNFEIFRSVLNKNCIEQNGTDLTFSWDIVKNQNFLVLIYEVPQNISLKDM